MALQKIGQLLDRRRSRVNFRERTIELIAKSGIGLEYLIKLRRALLQIGQRRLGLVQRWLQICRPPD